jgi:OmpA-OmpF porin, OOP family
MLKAQPTLKLHVVGHTDNVAGLDLNMQLSRARAEAVVQVLVAKHGIATTRLKGHGVGPLSPVASNDTESGRGKNRRVELVKQ